MGSSTRLPPFSALSIRSVASVAGSAQSPHCRLASMIIALESLLLK